jgi:hypothetical protein
MYTLLITKQAQIQELNTIFEVANNSGFPASIIHKLDDRIKQKLTKNNKSRHTEEKVETRNG